MAVAKYIELENEVKLEKWSVNELIRAEKRIARGSTKAFIPKMERNLESRESSSFKRGSSIMRQISENQARTTCPTSLDNHEMRDLSRNRS